VAAGLAPEQVLLQGGVGDKRCFVLLPSVGNRLFAVSGKGSRVVTGLVGQRSPYLSVARHFEPSR